MKTFIWVVALLILFVFLRYFLYPYVSIKIGLWISSYRLRKGAKKETKPEMRKMMEDIADGVDKVNRDLKL